MDENNDSLIEEINELKNEVKMLRAIVQSLMYVISEDQDFESDMEMANDEKDPMFGRSPSRNYVS